MSASAPAPTTTATTTTSSVALELLKKAEDYLLQLEARIAALEAENARKDETIRRLSSSAGAAGAGAAAVEVVTPGAEVVGASASTASSSAATKSSSSSSSSSEKIVTIIHKTPSLEERVEYAVYDDDPALGKPVPGQEWASLLWFNVPEGAGAAAASEGVKNAVKLGSGKPIVMTFFSNLNKGDYVTLSVLSQLKREERFGEDKVVFCAISRDGDKEDVPKFLRKVNGNYFAELTSTDGSPGVKVVADFPLAYDEGDAFNKMMKKVMVKGTVGVGMVVVVDREGVIRWYEKFVRGVNPMNQLEAVLEAVIAKKETLPVSNGKRPTASDEDDEDLQMEGEIPEDAFAEDTVAAVAGKKEGY